MIKIISKPLFTVLLCLMCLSVSSCSAVKFLTHAEPAKKPSKKSAKTEKVEEEFSIPKTLIATALVYAIAVAVDNGLEDSN